MAFSKNFEHINLAQPIFLILVPSLPLSCSSTRSVIAIFMSEKLIKVVYCIIGGLVKERIERFIKYSGTCFLFSRFGGFLIHCSVHFLVS